MTIAYIIRARVPYLFSISKSKNKIKVSTSSKKKKKKKYLHWSKSYTCGEKKRTSGELIKLSLNFEEKFAFSNSSIQ